MQLIAEDMKAGMLKMVGILHRLVPAARMGIAMFGGKGAKVQMHPLTANPEMLVYFLDHSRVDSGDIWEQDPVGGVTCAIDEMNWQQGTKRVVILIADSLPNKSDLPRLLEKIHKFKDAGGTFSALDVGREQHDRFEKLFFGKIGRDFRWTPLLEDFHQQTVKAFAALAKVGNGSMHSLASNEDIDHLILTLAFGEQWEPQLSAFARQDVRRSRHSGDRVDE
jgi:hypothetical protein